MKRFIRILLTISLLCLPMMIVYSNALAVENGAFASHRKKTNLKSGHLIRGDPIFYLINSSMAYNTIKWAG